MNRGWIHSAGKTLLPAGANCLMLRFMLEQWGRGFWFRKISDFHPKLREIYTDQRTYLEQVVEAISEGVEELFIDINTYGQSPKELEHMVAILSDDIFELGFQGRLIYGSVNEAPEHMGHSLYERFLQIMDKNMYQVREGLLRIKEGITASRYLDRIKLSAGLQSAADRKFYNYIFDKLHGVVDYFDFHSSNSGKLSDSVWIVDNSPQDTPLINSEHYFYDLARKKGYDSSVILDLNQKHWDFFKKEERIKSVYVLFPSVYRRSKRWAWLALRHHDENLNIVWTSRIYKQTEEIWKSIPKPQPEEDEDMKLSIYKNGSKGIVVEFIQKCLANLGYYEIHKIDSIFGPKTGDAVAAFQARWLGPEEADGVVGRKTMTALLEADPQNLVYWILLQAKYAYGER